MKTRQQVNYPNYREKLTPKKESLTVMYEVISAETRRLARDILEMLEEPVLSTNQRLTRIEKELKKRKRLRLGRNKK